MGLKEKLLAVDDLKREVVPVPELGGEKIYVRELTALDRDELGAEHLALQADGRANVNYRARVLVRCLCDASGELLFDKSSEEEIEQLGRKSSGLLDRLYQVAARLSGFGDEADEEVQGNSDAGQNGSSPIA